MSEWVKVSDRLPNDSETNEHGDVLAWEPVEQWQITHVTKLLERKHFTHWMPLPKEPL